MVTAKLLVPAGAPTQDSSGEWLPPVQPKPLKTCSMAMVPPSLKAGVVTVKPSAAWAEAWNTRTEPSNSELSKLRMCDSLGIRDGMYDTSRPRNIHRYSGLAKPRHHPTKKPPGAAAFSSAYPVTQ